MLVLIVKSIARNEEISTPYRAMILKTHLMATESKQASLNDSR